MSVVFSLWILDVLISPLLHHSTSGKLKSVRAWTKPLSRLIVTWKCTSAPVFFLLNVYGASTTICAACSPSSSLTNSKADLVTAKAQLNKLQNKSVVKAVARRKKPMLRIFLERVAKRHPYCSDLNKSFLSFLFFFATCLGCRKLRTWSKRRSERCKMRSTPRQSRWGRWPPSSLLIIFSLLSTFQYTCPLACQPQILQKTKERRALTEQKQNLDSELQELKVRTSFPLPERAHSVLLCSYNSSTADRLGPCARLKSIVLNAAGPPRKASVRYVIFVSLHTLSRAWSPSFLVILLYCTVNFKRNCPTLSDCALRRFEKWTRIQPRSRTGSTRIRELNEILSLRSTSPFLF